MIELFCAFQSFFGLLILPRDKQENNVRLFLVIFMGFSILCFSKSTNILIVKPTILLFFMFSLSLMVYLFARQNLTAKTKYGKRDLLYLSPIIISLVFIDYDSVGLILGIGGLTLYIFLTLLLYWKWLDNPKNKEVNRELTVVIGLVLIAIQLTSFTFTSSLNIFSAKLHSIIMGISWLLNLFVVNYWLFNELHGKYAFFSVLQPELDSNQGLINASEDDFLKNIFDDLHKTVVGEGLYKIHRISLFDVSQQTGFNVRDISRAINVYNQTSFNNYINHLRIDSVKQSFMQDNKQHINILNIGLSSGFSSKTTFNTAFKKFSGCTPSVFVSRMNQQKNSDGVEQAE
jgi:AraC-like DNA-binding protein